MISVFTPSHDTKYIFKVYDTLADQTYDNWEWIVLLNGSAVNDRLEIDDPRVKVHRTTSGGIGALKAEAVDLCTGSILVELDHDDELDADALFQIHDAFMDHPGVSLVYMDTAQMDKDGKPVLDRFSADHGWKYYEHDGYQFAKSFGPHPHNVSLIWYAPNHPRAFTREAYDAAGGYNRELAVLDDQDLMARLYLQGRFLHVPYPMYYQRVWDKNTQAIPEVNAEIQRSTVRMHDENIKSMSKAWADRIGLLALDLGAAHNKPEGWTGVDLVAGEGVDMVGDFLELDLEPNSVAVIRAYDFMEHIADKQAFMKKAYKLLCDGGMLLTMTPSTDGRGAFQDPTHVSYWNENSFWYYTDRNFANFADAGVRFQISHIETLFPSLFHEAHNISYVRANLIALKSNSHQFGGLVLI